MALKGKNELEKFTDKCGYKNSQYAIPIALVETYKNTLKPYWMKEDTIAATERIAKRISNYIFGKDCP